MPRGRQNLAKRKCKWQEQIATESCCSRKSGDAFSLWIWGEKRNFTAVN